MCRIARIASHSLVLIPSSTLPRRYAGTNAVATINNGSVANMRIICGSRSPNAAVWFQFAYRPNLLQQNNMGKIKAALEQYARDNPRDWYSFGAYFRVDELHPEIVTTRLKSSS